MASKVSSSRGRRRGRSESKSDEKTELVERKRWNKKTTLNVRRPRISTLETTYWLNFNWATRVELKNKTPQTTPHCKNPWPGPAARTDHSGEKPRGFEESLISSDLVTYIHYPKHPKGFLARTFFLRRCRVVRGSYGCGCRKAFGSTFSGLQTLGISVQLLKTRRYSSSSTLPQVILFHMFCHWVIGIHITLGWSNTYKKWFVWTDIW